MNLGKHIVYDKHKTMDSSNSIGQIIYDNTNILLEMLVGRELYNLVDKDVRMNNKLGFNSLYFEIWVAVYYSLKNAIDL